MMRMLRMGAMLGLAIGNVYAAGQDPPTLALQAGAAKVEITPPASALVPGDAIRDPLYVRALFIGNGATCAVLVGVEQGNIPTPVVDDAVQRAAAALGCPATNLIVSATHTHSGNTAGLIATGSPTPKQVGDAIVEAAMRARASLRPARVGYGTTQVYLNVNRDLFEGNTWYQGTNREGPSDKTLAIIEFVGADGLPIGVYMNYAMHPINFYLSGLISADFPGEASRYVERRFPGAIAVFSQGASGDQNPLLDRPFNKLASVRTRMPDAHDDRLTTPDGWKVVAQLLNANVAQTAEMKKPITSAEVGVYRDAVAQVGEIATAEGALIGESAIDVMKNLIPQTSPVAEMISLQESFTCPGRDRVDTSARQGVLPTYTDGEPVNIRLGLLRIGDIAVATVNGEVYSEIAMRLKKQAPSNKLVMVTLANGRANSGYIYSNNAAHHLTFQVIGSRLKPGCAEDQIVSRLVDMDERIAGK